MKRFWNSFVEDPINFLFRLFFFLFIFITFGGMLVAYAKQVFLELK